MRWQGDGDCRHQADDQNVTPDGPTQAGCVGREPEFGRGEQDQQSAGCGDLACADGKPAKTRRALRHRHGVGQMAQRKGGHASQKGR
ncbi:MAG: hypothetical protein ACD_54C01130G0001, partial [uncultured bacterium]